MSTTTSHNNSNAAPAFSGSSREGAVAGNTSGAAGSRGGAPPKPTLSEQMGITMPADTKIISHEREGDHVEPNVLPGESLSTAGPGGDMKRREPAAHELKGMKQRLENDDERASRERLGYDEPINRLRKPANDL
ncbi:hypothetical protein JCM10908_001029 [Rhodotorula pacifica]|uniref:uncharacterized protein n=1 Tax=Rhodotorula pacifica TaxID=1495444 RepID=UPI003181D395